MRVASNTLPTNFLNEVNKLSSRNADLQKQLATGQRVSRASDDSIDYRQAKELQSKERSMFSFRSNLQQANLITDLTESALEFIKESSRQAWATSNMIDASINDSTLMKTNANLINSILEQVTDTFNSKNAEEYMFSGAYLTTKPYETIKDIETGKVGFADIKTNTADFSEVGGVKSPAANSTFTTPSSLTGLDVTFGGAELSDGTNTVTTQASLLANTTYTVVKNGDPTLVKDRTYEITDNGSTADFSEIGGVKQPDTSSTFTTPTSLTGLNATFGGATLSDGTNTVTDAASLLASTTYTVTDNGSTADFSEIGGTTNPYTNSTFTTPASLTGLNATFNGATLSDGTNTVTDVANLLVSTTYTVTNNGSADFTSSGATDNNKGTTFVYNGTTAPTWGAASVKLVASDITSAESNLLVEGRAYEIKTADGSALDASENFMNSGAHTNTVGHQFIYNGYSPTWANTNTVLVPLQVEDSAKIIDSTSLTSNDIYKIARSAPLGSELPNLTEGDTVTAGKTYRVAKVNSSDDDLTSFGGTTDAKVGDIFLATSAGTIIQDNLELKAIYLPTDNTSVAATSSIDEGETYLITSAGDFSARGGNATGLVGQIFTATSTGVLDATASSTATVEKLILPITESDNVNEDESFIIAATTTDSLISNGTTVQVTVAGGDLSTYGGNNPAAIGDIFTTTAAVTTPDSASLQRIETLSRSNVSEMVEGKTYTIADNGNRSDFTHSGSTSNNNGTIFTYNGTAPSFGGGGIITEVGGDGTAIVDSSEMVNGTSYQIIENGSSADFTTSGANNNNAGTSFTYNGIAPPFASGSILEVASTGEQITYPNELKSGTEYRIVYNPENTNFTDSGAADSNLGTTFTYNGTMPENMGSAFLIEKPTATDFTTAGADDSDLNTIFTANGTAPDFGANGKLFQYRVERTVASDFTLSGSANNNTGTTFTYNNTTPTFGDTNGDGAILFGYTRERIASAYVGSGSNREFYVAEDKKLAINNDVQHNANFDDFINALAMLREAYDMAGNASNDDDVTREAAKEKIKEAANRLDKADDDVLLALSDVGIKQIKLNVAEANDNMLFEKREEIIGRRTLINEVEVITRLNQSINAYQAALQSGARTMTLSLMDFM